MKRSPAIFWLMKHDPTLAVAVVLLGLIVIPSGNIIAQSVWMAFPVFLAATAFLMPVDSWLKSLPILRSQVVLARILAVLAMVWLPLLTVSLWGKSVMWGTIPWANFRRPAEFACLLTASMLLAWTSLASLSQRRRRVAASLAAIAMIAALFCLPWACVGAVVPIALISIWVATPWERMESKRGAAHPGWVWILLRSAFSWRLVPAVLLAALVGLKLSWTWVPFLGLFLVPGKFQQPWLLTLPIARRTLLWAMLVPVLAPFLVGTVVGYRVGRQDWNIQTRWQPVPSVPLDYYWNSSGPTAPVIRSPWGETVQPPIRTLFGTSEKEYVYNPYWVGPENSQRFAEWQFARETRVIYGREVSKDGLPAAIRAGLKQTTQQARMQLLTLAFGTGLLLAIALLITMRQWHTLGRIPRNFLTALSALPFALMFSSLFVSDKSSSFDPLGGTIQSWLLRLSAVLPHNNILMTAIVLMALAPLYWALETVFNQAEFPDKKIQETV